MLRQRHLIEHHREQILSKRDKPKQAKFLSISKQLLIHPAGKMQAGTTWRPRAEMITERYLH